MPRAEIPLQRLHLRLLKATVTRIEDALEDPSGVTSYRLRRGIPFEGRLFLAPPAQAAPPWMDFVQTGIQGSLERLLNRSNAAVLVVRASRRLFAISFGYGRHCLREALLEPDFGLRTALNSLDHSSLRALDSLTIEDQTLHTRSQASRASSLQAFGLDVGKDILRAVTGLPRADVPLNSVSGSGAALAITARTDFPGLGRLCSLLLRLYRMTTYRDHFPWVDNVAAVSDADLVIQLDQQLLNELSSRGHSRPYLAPPEPLDWQLVQGFNYTDHRRSIDPDLSLEAYLQGSDLANLDLQTLRSDKAYAYGPDPTSPVHHWPIYKCLVFETTLHGKTYVLTAGTWFEIEPTYAGRIRRTLEMIPLSQLRLPSLGTTADGRQEVEGDFNSRASQSDPTLALMDRKLATCASAGTPIEFCDLLSTSRHIVHVKHRKGGSSSLSHLFAQARVSAEALLSDEQFRLEVRNHLSDLGTKWTRLIPAEKPDPSQYEIVLALLAAPQTRPGQDLPFFSQLNLIRTYQNLVSFGYSVSLLGIPVAAATTSA